MEGGGELGIHYLKTWSRDPLPPPKEIGSGFRKVLEAEMGRGGVGMNPQGRGKNHFGG